MMKPEKAREYAIRYYWEHPTSGGCITQEAYRWAYDAKDAVFQFELEKKSYFDRYFRVVAVGPVDTAKVYEPPKGSMLR